MRCWPKAKSGCANACNRNSNRKPTTSVGFFPQSQRRLRQARAQLMHLRTAVGVVELVVWYGLDPTTRRWGCPLRQQWGLTAHQQLSPGFQDRLAFTVTATGSYEQAAAVAAKWGCPTDDATLHALVQRLGAKAEKQTKQRLATVPAEVTPHREPNTLMVLQLDGWQVRHRGLGWGRKRTKNPRVEWHELKTGVAYRHDQAAQTAGGRGLLAEKVVVSWQGEPLELGRRLHWEALRHGLARSRDTLVVADGAPWIWNVAADRWGGATELLDFYHASQHLWELGRALSRGDETLATAWVEPRRHQLRHGNERAVLRQVAALRPTRGESGEAVRREQRYFAGQAARMKYHELAQRGWPIGSGAVESACRQRQCRFKRPGQFWTASGLRHLGALIEAQSNGHWDSLWQLN